MQIGLLDGRTSYKPKDLVHMIYLFLETIVHYYSYYLSIGGPARQGLELIGMTLRFYKFSNYV